MVRKPKITSLAELQQRKKEVRLEMELAKREFAHSLGTSRENTSQFLLKNVAAPVGGGLAGLWLLGKIIPSRSGKTREVVRETKVVHEYPEGYAESIDRRSPAYRAGIRGEKKKKAFNISLLVGIAKLIIPVVQAVIGAVNSHKAADEAEEASHAAKRASYR